ncbi:MAG: hypothetical protein K0S71_1299 [Clostridia bacterium]|jgi:O-antigen/teichoic acid export membrane protein|nr:hypothetical protein [Clostridia bacterium]
MKKIVQNEFVLSLITKGILVILGLVTSIIINRYLGPSLKGEYAYVLNLINILSLVLNLGIYHSYPYNRKNSGVDIKNRYFGISFYQYFAYMFISVIIIIFFRDRNVIIIALLTPLMVLTKQLIFICLVEDFKLRNLIITANQIIYSIFLILLSICTTSSLIYVFVLLMGQELLTVVVIVKKYKIDILRRSFNFEDLNNVLKFGFYPMITSLLITLNYKVDILILKYFVDFEQIGFYTIGVGLATQAWMIPDAFKEVLFSRTAKEDPIDIIILCIKINLYVSIAIILAIAYWGKNIINIMYGSAYLPSYSVAVIMFLGLIPMIFYKMIISLFNANKKQRISFNILLIAVIFNVLLNLATIPKYGIIGAAFSSVISYSVSGILFTRYFIKEYNINAIQLILLSKKEIYRILQLFRLSHRNKFKE